jgi:hypothetical protein
MKTLMSVLIAAVFAWSIYVRVIEPMRAQLLAVLR